MTESSKKSKVLLWVGDSPMGNTGFGRVTENVCDWLTDQGWEIHVLGVNHIDGPVARKLQQTKWRFEVYAATGGGGDVWGIQRLGFLMDELRPDAVVLNADSWICESYFRQMAKVCGAERMKTLPVLVYFPVDSRGYHAGHVQWMLGHNLLAPVTYTNFGRRQIEGAFAMFDPEALARQNVKVPEVGVIGHGVASNVYHPMSREEAMAVLDKSGKDALAEIGKDMIFLNANRNSVRKAIPDTIRAFFKFMARRPEATARLWLHMEIHGSDGYDIKRAAMEIHAQERVGKPISECFLVTDDDFNNYTALTEEELCALYNFVDVGITTARAEGWGLIPMEMAACRRPLIVPDHTAFREIWSGAALKTPISHQELQGEAGMSLWHECVNIEECSLQIERLYDDWADKGELLEKLADAAYRRVCDPRFSWRSIAQEFHLRLLGLLEESAKRVEAKSIEDEKRRVVNERTAWVDFIAMNQSNPHVLAFVSDPNDKDETQSKASQLYNFLKSHGVTEMTPDLLEEWERLNTEAQSEQDS